MHEQLKKRLERLSQRIEEAERKGEFEHADELRVELNAVQQVLSEMTWGR